MGRERNIVIDTRQTDLTPTTRIKGEYNTDGWRRMTPREWGALQGYPVYNNGDGSPVFQIPVADASAYKQFGNSVAVPAIQATALQMLKVLSNKKNTLPIIMANKGEWSEVYAFFKLLADGRLYCGDGHLNRYDEKYYPILKIFRNDAPDRNAYKVHSAKKSILVASETIHIEIPQDRFRIEAAKLLETIKKIGGGEHEDTLKFMHEIDCGPVKAKSTDKADIRIVIHNLATGSKPELGYSIKSKLGGDSTLINSNKDASNFIFKIEGINDAQMRHINSLDKFKQKFDYIREVGGSWSFSKVSGETLRNNLTMLDLGMACIVAACIEKYYTGQGSEVAGVCRKVAQEDPLHINSSEGQPMYA